MLCVVLFIRPCLVCCVFGCFVLCVVFVVCVFFFVLFTVCCLCLCLLIDVFRVLSGVCWYVMFVFGCL